MRQGHVYILTTKNNSVLYTGSTTDLIRRVNEHIVGTYPKAFTKKYSVHKLIYYEYFEDFYFARVREKQIKEWKRSWKIELIQTINPEFRDLFEELLG